MPIVQCPGCGHVSKFESTSQCLRCANVIVVKPKKAASKSQKIIFSTIFGICILALAVYGATYFISWQQEQARLELEKKQLEEFDMINFKADPDSVKNAVNSLPVYFNFQHPPDSDSVKQIINSLESTKRKSETNTTNRNVKFQTKGNTEYKCLPGSTIGTVGPATMTTGGCGNYAAPSIQNSMEVSTTTTVVTSYSVIEFQPTQFDYVKGAENKLFCFVTYQATIGIFKQNAKNPYGDIKPPKFGNEPPDIKELGNKVGEYDVKETAKYELENGNWVFREAGLSDFNRILRIDEIRINAITKMPQ